MSEIGLRRGTVELVPHNSNWKLLYEEESLFLRKILHEYFAGITHIGSTSIPGIVAKPIIDIALAVHNLDRVQEIIGIMESNGYIYRGEILLGIPDRHLFVKGTDNFRTHHIHLLPITHNQWETLQQFRDYLLAHPEDAKKYENIKLELQRQFPTDREKYLEGKAEFIQKIIKIAQKMK